LKRILCQVALCYIMVDFRPKLALQRRQLSAKFDDLINELRFGSSR
jgi:hypothetical protein